MPRLWSQTEVKEVGVKYLPGAFLTGDSLGPQKTAEQHSSQRY